MPFQPSPASEQGPLAVGERLSDLPFRDVHGQVRSLYDNHYFGWPKVIHLATSPEDAEPELRRLAQNLAEFRGVETHVFGVTRAAAAVNAALAERIRLPYPLLSDEAGRLHRAAGLAPGAAPCTLVFDPILKLERRITGADGATQAETALAHARARFARLCPAVATAQAPTLVVPNLIEPEHCRRLIALWDRGHKLENTTSSETAKMRTNPKTKIRSDVYVLLGTPESDELLAVMRRRLLPEISKAFNFEVTRLEHFRVGCYDGARGGYFAAHRDNSKEITAHRRYALAVNLNVGEYEGGYLRLPEYGPQLYAPPTGGGAVFSCSLLHLVTPVTKGRRFALVSFLWGEAEQPIFERSHADMFPEGTDFNRIP